MEVSHLSSLVGQSVKGVLDFLMVEVKIFFIVEINMFFRFSFFTFFTKKKSYVTRFPAFSGPENR